MPDTPQLPNGWNAWGNHVLKALESNEGEHTKINDTLNELVTKIAVIETKMMLKASTAGAFTGLISAVIVGVVVWFITK